MSGSPETCLPLITQPWHSGSAIAQVPGRKFLRLCKLFGRRYSDKRTRLISRPPALALSAGVRSIAENRDNQQNRKN